MQAKSRIEKILQNIMELVLDIKLFVEISFDIAKTQIKNLWSIWLEYSDWPISTWGGLAPPGTRQFILPVLCFPPYKFCRILEWIQKPVTKWSYLMGRVGNPKLVKLNMINRDFWWKHQCMVLFREAGFPEKLWNHHPWKCSNDVAPGDRV